jgi:hypothetical protein
MNTRARVIAVGLVILAVIGVGGVGAAGAGGGNQPHTDPIVGDFSFNTVDLKLRICAGADGPYVEIVLRQAGTAAGDPRITGDMELTSHLLLNRTTGVGTSEGRFEVRDPATGRRKAAGGFLGVVTPASLTSAALDGLLVGQVFDEGAGTEEQVGRGRVVANFEAEFDNATLNGTGSFGIGAPPTVRPNPALIQGGHCTGRFTSAP